jgi:hypothetical protein
LVSFIEAVNPSTVGINPKGPFTNHNIFCNCDLRTVGTEVYMLVT